FMTMKKIFLTGGSGFLGWHVIRALAGRYELCCASHASPLPDMMNIRAMPVDFLTPCSLKNIIEPIEPDIVIHMAALSKTGFCEENPEIAHRINVEATREILEGTNPVLTRVIYISTDLVFDGSKGFYRESDIPNPTMVYSQTKLEAENLVQSRGGNYAILRLALMYGKGSPGHDSFLSWLEKDIAHGSVILFTDEYRTPLYVRDAASAIDRLVESDFTGIMHLGGGRRCSRYEFGIEFTKQKGYPVGVIVGKKLMDTPINMVRPPDVSLDSTLAKSVLGIHPRSFEKGIADYLGDASCTDEVKK
ncbi:SDR family oxidoreductase, partial [Candidatus Sumerlaeota bacterium]|nr:SDR family oxidoreductase [Candidatus Sumerlaeota bacterium]